MKRLPYLPEVAQEAEGEPAESVVMEAEVGELQGSRVNFHQCQILRGQVNQKPSKFPFCFAVERLSLTFSKRVISFEWYQMNKIRIK